MGRLATGFCGGTQRQESMYETNNRILGLAGINAVYEAGHLAGRGIQEGTMTILIGCFTAFMLVKLAYWAADRAKKPTPKQPTCYEQYDPSVDYYKRPGFKGLHD